MTEVSEGSKINSSYRSSHTSPKTLEVTVFTHTRAAILEYSTAAWGLDDDTAIVHTPSIVHIVLMAHIEYVICLPVFKIYFVMFLFSFFPTLYIHVYIIYIYIYNYIYIYIRYTWIIVTIKVFFE